jgi:SNF2 family DNA or RNA helicase
LVAEAGGQGGGGLFDLAGCFDGEGSASPSDGVACFAIPEVASVRLPRPAVRVQSIKFPDASLLEQPHQKPQTSGAVARCRPSAPTRLDKPPLPPNAPLADRLRSALQPPVSVLIGDSNVWLPFDPFPYQYEGIQFLFSRWSALLGDEMGLGKTMQTILAIRLLLRAGAISSVLLACPKPLTTNWQREFAMWADEIPIAVVQGETHARCKLWLHDRSAVKLVNYECLARDAEFLQESQVAFDLAVIDEAQRIKNRDSRTAAAVHNLRRRRSWLLTGTPVENHAGDLVSLLEFANNGVKVADDSPGVLRAEVAKVLLRRTKDMVIDDMPPKLVRDTFVDLAPTQRERYDAAEREGVMQMNAMEEACTIEHVFELIRWLKNICNFDPITGESAKAEKLHADLEEIAASGKKAILFSQYVTTLERLADSLRGFRPLLFHGKVPQSQRDGVIKTFREERDRPVILMSYGTGAVGLNLQFANYVFLYDRWWNPAVEDQAINRAHRLGQREPVFVSRFISPATIEERVAQILAKKRDLFTSIIDGLEPAESVLTEEEVFGLFDLKIRKRAAEKRG